jgi:hypothetical protein
MFTWGANMVRGVIGAPLGEFLKRIFLKKVLRKFVKIFKNFIALFY